MYKFLLMESMDILNQNQPLKNRSGMDFNLNSINGILEESLEFRRKERERWREGWVNHIILYPVTTTIQGVFKDKWQGWLFRSGVKGPEKPI